MGFGIMLRGEGGKLKKIESGGLWNKSHICISKKRKGKVQKMRIKKTVNVPINIRSMKWNLMGASVSEDKAFVLLINDTVDLKSGIRT